ncbi:hypothetical protein AOZ06_46660 [Kibdelosporangium phytohabitans]|uniref:MrfA-like Zn-binding domain-containing protein n=2 Tax=Kibdelosporangium phytohabitans TaxID=860235 RepID=A0A0N9I5K5_9PSEU|nr:DUF1998 domain-containing protein [Kibdelosporangium phytohabitans]ALG13358.1 hypothetical protein AOZ06_46660 [Kibdelosporangium phytohabitans]
MTPPPARLRLAPRLRKLGVVRRSQLITTYGVGALIAVDNESFIVSGLDSWDTSAAPEVFERRLAQVLGVKSFRLPPTPDTDEGVDGVRVRRFPEFYSCPGCCVLQPFFRFGSLAGRARCGECDEDLVPSRFVLACDDGHIEDFPYWKWVHRGQNTASGLCGGTLTLRIDGNTASLRSVIVSCDCGVSAVSMEGAFRAKTLKELGIRCGGRRPWLKEAAAEPCSQQPRAMQRGSSSIWHPVMRSALSIPPWSEGIDALLERERMIGAPEEAVRWHFSSRSALLRPIKVTLEDVVARALAISTEAPKQPSPADTHDVLRQEEYESLVRGNPEKHASGWQSFVCEPPTGDRSAVRQFGIDGCMLVKRLREVRALQAFMRGVAPLESESGQRHAKLWLSAEADWLPAVEVNGEGVFISLDADRLHAWETDPAVIARSEQLRRNHLALLEQRAASTSHGKGAPVESYVSPRFVLLHTLAHVLMDEWSLDGGYPVSALRERLYASEEMAGVLIYTATSDSAGSLGGIVAQGEPQRLASTLNSALARASWCSNDPLCVESAASGVDSVNLAACHACVLLPETSCENNNSFMDRAMLIGTPSGDVPGYFRACL